MSMPEFLNQPPNGNRSLFRQLVTSLTTDSRVMWIQAVKPADKNEKDFYRKFLQERDVLAPSEFVGSHLDAILDNFVSVIPDKKAKEIVDKFRQNNLQEDIFVIKKGNFEKVVEDFTVYYKHDVSAAISHTTSGFIFIREEEMNLSTLTEEVVHKLFDYNLSIANRIYRYMFKMSNLLTDYKKFYDNRHQLIDKYLSSPAEQIGKAVTVRILNNFKEIPEMYPEEMESVKLGEKRIKEIGWPRVLKGDFYTRNENNYLVTFKPPETKTYKLLRDKLNIKNQSRSSLDD